jgi:hypothetical protein
MMMKPKTPMQPQAARPPAASSSAKIKKVARDTADVLITSATSEEFIGVYAKTFADNTKKHSLEQQLC